MFPAGASAKLSCRGCFGAVPEWARGLGQTQGCAGLREQEQRGLMGGNRPSPSEDAGIGSDCPGVRSPMNGLGPRAGPVAPRRTSSRGWACMCE